MMHKMLIYLIILFYTGSLNETRSHFYIKVHEEKFMNQKHSVGNRVYLTLWVSVESIDLTVVCVNKDV